MPRPGTDAPEDDVLARGSPSPERPTLVIEADRTGFQWLDAGIGRASVPPGLGMTAAARNPSGCADALSLVRIRLGEAAFAAAWVGGAALAPEDAVAYALPSRAR